MNGRLLLCVLTIGSAIASPNERTFVYGKANYYHADLAFIRSGALAWLGIMDLSDKQWIGRDIIYTSSDGTTILVDGTPPTMEFVLRSEFPDGLSETFLKNAMATALLRLSVCGRAYVIDSKVATSFAQLKLKGQSETEMYEALKTVQLPIAITKGGTWELKFTYFIEDGRVYEASYCGGLKPFSIDSSSTKILGVRIPTGVLVGEGQSFQKE